MTTPTHRERAREWLRGCQAKPGHVRYRVTLDEVATLISTIRQETREEDAKIVSSAKAEAAPEWFAELIRKALP